MIFDQVLRQAVDDLTQRGFDSAERVAVWVHRLREAARQSLVPEHILAETLTRTLGATYRRLVEKGAILSLHPGVGRFTLERVKPRLRAELDRRINASAQLIRLNREEAIETTLRRFAGWASSVPPGGAERSGDRTETKADVRKPLQSLPFRERRVAIDQGAKFVSALNQVLAEGAGALAAEWHSRFRVPGYDYREDHKERDGRIYLIRGSWAHEQGLVKASDETGWFDLITKPGEEVFCFPGDSRLTSAYGVEVGYRRWYSGELTELVVASGKTLRATPNHPVLTPRGWVAVGLLQEGDDVLEIADQVIGVPPREANPNYAEPSLAETFQTLVEAGRSEVRGGERQQFHGDGSENNVDIVSVDRPLSFSLAGQAQTVKVIKIKRKQFAGHVYNLQTVDDYYTVEGIFVHNCRCSARYIYGLADLPVGCLTAKGREALARAKGKGA